MKLGINDRIPMVEAERRALAYMEHGKLYPASDVAAQIWPCHRMKPQGAGAAASRILKSLEKKGLVRWTVRGDSWGWCR